MGPQNRGFSLCDSASGGNHNPDAGSQSEGQSDSERDQSSRTFHGEASVPTLGRDSQPRLYTACLEICTFFKVSWDIFLPPSWNCPGLAHLLRSSFIYTFSRNFSLISWVCGLYYILQCYHSLDSYSLLIFNLCSHLDAIDKIFIETDFISCANPHRVVVS